MITWVKPNGNTITTNELPETLAFAKKAGWEQYSTKDEQTAKTVDVKAKKTKKTT